MLGPTGAITCTSSQRISFTRLAWPTYMFGGLIARLHRSLKWPCRSEYGPPACR